MGPPHGGYQRRDQYSRNDGQSQPYKRQKYDNGGQNNDYGGGGAATSNFDINNLQAKNVVDILDSINNQTDNNLRKQKVCTFWMKGNCRKSDEECDFLHAMVEDRMPMCKFFQ